ncbi:hypothetical protein [Halobacillus litoralis]|nr:hypothetical protein [Halobacillus litoralis]
MSSRLSFPTFACQSEDEWVRFSQVPTPLGKPVERFLKPGKIESL